MNKISNWGCKVDFRTHDYARKYIYKFRNSSCNPVIYSIIIKIIQDNQDTILSKNTKIYLNKNNINGVFNNLSKYHREIFLYGNKIIIPDKAEYLFEEIIFYLEQIEEIHPINILEKILKTGCNPRNPCNYPKIFKNKIFPDIYFINLGILKKLDKECHNNFMKLKNINQKLKILKYNNQNPFEYKYNLIENLSAENLNQNQMKKLINTIEILTEENDKYDSIYDINMNIYFIYLNYLSVEDIFKKLNAKIDYKRAFETINYIYTQIDLTYKQNIELIKIINNRFSNDDLNILKYKIISKLITNNTNLDNEIYNELIKYEDSTEALIQFIINRKENFKLKN